MIRLKIKKFLYRCNTVNVHIFACIHFRGFPEIGIFAWIKICVLRIFGSVGYHKTNFHGVHIFADL